MFKPRALAIVAVATLLALPAFSQAQTTQPGQRLRRFQNAGASTQPSEARPRGDGSLIFERVQQLANDLKLTDEQKTKVKSIFDDAKQELGAMRSELQGMAPPDRREKVMAFITSVREKIAGVLTDEQKAEFQKKMDALRQNAGGGPGAMIERLRDSLQKLDLSEEQRAKIKDVMEGARAKFQQLREEAQNDAAQMRDKGRELMQDTRQQLRGILTPEQQQKLRELMGAPTTQNAGGPPNPKGLGPASERGNAPRSPGQRTKPTTVPAVGQAVPDMNLRKLDGSSVQLSSYKGRVLVLEFGSYSAPSFRQRAAAMEQLKRETSARATFLLVYTKEAHPVGGWEVDRNKDEKISMEQHSNIADRRAAATKARDTLKVTLPVVLDEMDDSISSSFAAGENSLVIIAKNGTLFARQEWVDPTGARRLIEEASK